MEIATFVYKEFLRTKGNRKKIWGLARKILIRIFNDPICTLSVHGRSLKLPLSHPLPLYFKELRFYDRLPRRISQYVHLRHGFLTCIDVGANIGDSIASFYENDSDLFLAIEPNPKFHQLLISNWGWNKNIVPKSVVCASSSGMGTFELNERNGTASVRHAESGNTMIRQSLDDLVKQNPGFVKSNVIKIDTDGHDFDVIAGATKLVATNHPIILFECDVFGNANYVEDCLMTLGFFERTGYNYFLLYDNLGNYFGRFSLSDLQPFKNLLFYQLTGNRCYFDILLMPDEDLLPFFRLESDYFAGMVSDNSLERTTRVAMASFETHYGVS